MEPLYILEKELKIQQVPYDKDSYVEYNHKNWTVQVRLMHGRDPLTVRRTSGNKFVKDELGCPVPY